MNLNTALPYKRTGDISGSTKICFSPVQFFGQQFVLKSPVLKNTKKNYRTGPPPKLIANPVYRLSFYTGVGGVIMIKFRISKFDLKDNFINDSKKIECSQISKFLRFRMIGSSAFELLYRSPNPVEQKRRLKFSKLLARPVPNFYYQIF